MTTEIQMLNHKCQSIVALLRTQSELSGLRELEVDLSLDQQKRQDIVLPFYLICFAYLSFVLMYELIGGFSDLRPIVKPIIVETDSASGNEMRPDDMEIVC